MRWPYFVAILAVGRALAQDAVPGVPAQEAWRDRGKNETVCGQVVDTSYATSVRNAPTYLYLERPRPQQIFTVVLPSASRDLFGESPEKSFLGKHICVTGKIESDTLDGVVDPKHRATLVVSDDEQLTVR